MSARAIPTSGPKAFAPALPSPVLELCWSVGGDGTFLGPSGVTALDDGLMLVVDECRHGLVVLDENGSVVRRLGEAGSAPGSFRYPTQAVADGDGGFWVTDRWNHRVQRLDASGRVLCAAGSYGPAPGEFNEPWGIAVGDDGRLVVSDRSNHRLQVVSGDGAFVGTCGRGGYDRFYYEGKAFKGGYVYQRWGALSNRFMPHETLFHEQGYTLGTLEYPQGLAACGGGRVLVADPGIGVVLRCTLETGAIEPLTAPGARPAPTNVAGIGGGLFVAVADAGNAAWLLDAEGCAAQDSAAQDSVAQGSGAQGSGARGSGARGSVGLFEVPGIEHLTACAPGPGGTLWCLDGWNHRLACYRLELGPVEAPSSVW